MGKGIESLYALPEWNGSGDFGLAGIRKVMQALGDPQDKVPCVHVAGTNGKGSVSAGVAAILGASGKKVGLTISPHLYSVNERILINGLPISDEHLDSFLDAVFSAAHRVGKQLSYFEAITASAFMAFHELKMDFMVIETGLGGRLDATNIVNRPVATAITSIDLEHEEILGNTLAKIATEKAGIIKDNVPVVVGKLMDEPLAVIKEVAAKHSAPMRTFGRDFSCELISNLDPDGLQLFQYTSMGSKCSHPCDFLTYSKLGEGPVEPTYPVVSSPYDNASGVMHAIQARAQDCDGLKYKPSLRGQHQGENMATVLALGEVLSIEKSACKQGIESLFWPGRLEERVYCGRRVIMDCGHNPAGISTLVSYLESRGLKNLSIAFGAVKNKNWTLMIDKLMPFCARWSVLKPDSSRAVEPKEVCHYLSRFGVKSADFGSDYDAFLASERDSLDKSDLLLTGSMYMLGRLRKPIVPEITPIWIYKGTEC